MQPLSHTRKAVTGLPRVCKSTWGTWDEGCELQRATSLPMFGTMTPGSVSLTGALRFSDRHRGRRAMHATWLQDMKEERCVHVGSMVGGFLRTWCLRTRGGAVSTISPLAPQLCDHTEMNPQSASPAVCCRTSIGVSQPCESLPRL